MPGPFVYKYLHLIRLDDVLKHQEVIIIARYVPWSSLISDNVFLFFIIFFFYILFFLKSMYFCHSLIHRLYSLLFPLELLFENTLYFI